MIFEESENLILEIIATNDFLYTAFGKIEGIIIPPKKLRGFYTVLDRVVDRDGWTCAKSGNPKMTFNKKATLTYRIDPQIFFNSPEERLTTLAREYRKDVGIPEIPEYEGLPEEKIKDICKKIDKEKGRTLNKAQQKRKERDIISRQKYNISRDAILVEMDIQNQRDSGIPEEQIQRRSPEEIRKQMMLEWAEKSRVKEIIFKKERDKIERLKQEEKEKQILDEEDEKFYFSIK